MSMESFRLLTLREGIQHVISDPCQAVLRCVCGGWAGRGGADGHRHGATGTVAGWWVGRTPRLRLLEGSEGGECKNYNVTTWTSTDPSLPKKHSQKATTCRRGYRYLIYFFRLSPCSAFSMHLRPESSLSSMQEPLEEQKAGRKGPHCPTDWCWAQGLWPTARQQMAGQTAVTLDVRCLALMKGEQVSDIWQGDMRLVVPPWVTGTKQRHLTGNGSFMSSLWGADVIEIAQRDSLMLYSH